jgi:hypothetical protein
MKPQNTLCLSLLATLSLVAGSASAAAAHDEEAPPPWPPMETDGYVPVSEDYYNDITFPACGTMITLRAGDVQDVYQKIRVKDDGTTVVKYRGSQTADVIADKDGVPPYDAFIDELDVSGRYTLRISADERTVVETIGGPSIVYPVSETDSAALAAAGLSDFFYFENGKLKLQINLTEDKDAVEPESVEVLKNTTRGVVDLCEALAMSAGK